MLLLGAALASALPASLAAQADSAKAAAPGSTSARPTQSDTATRPRCDTAAAAKPHRGASDSLDAVGTTRAGVHDTAPFGFPSPWVWALFATAALGAVGAFAGDLVTDNGRLERGSRNRTEIMLGWPSNLVVGAVAALIMTALNRPDASWPALIATALSAGVGGKAVLQGITATGRAQLAEADTKVAKAAGKARLDEQATDIVDLVRSHETAPGDMPATKGLADPQRHHDFAVKVREITDRHKAALEAVTAADR